MAMKNRALPRRKNGKVVKPARQLTKTPPPAPAKSARPTLLPTWLVLGLCLLLAGGGTWAAAEFFFFSKLPPELVGKWVVRGGPQDGATFDFFRGGSMEAHLNNNGMEVVIKARATLEGKTLLTTTQNPHTKQDETTTSTIRELTRDTLVIETKQGEVFRMTRAE
jgi:uncharacterized protein (TIGR03066 family)